MKLVQVNNIKTIMPCDMKEGQIGIIRQWASDSNRYIGTIVIVSMGTLIALGLEHITWSQVMTMNMPDCQIEILSPGTLLEV